MRDDNYQSRLPSEQITTMIIVLTTMISEITQSDYDQIVNAINLLTLPCPHCKCIGMCIFAYYVRKVKNASCSEKTNLRILRVQCKNEECRATHALLPSTIVPYSQITMYDTIDMINASSEEDEHEILDRNVHIDPKDILRVKLRYSLFWQSWISEITETMGETSFFTSCIEKFKMHFMQVPPTLCGSYSCHHTIWAELPL